MKKLNFKFVILVIGIIALACTFYMQFSFLLDAFLKSFGVAQILAAVFLFFSQFNKKEIKKLTSKATFKNIN